MRPSRWAWALVAVAELGGATARGQTTPTGSRYLAIDHWAYQYIARLRDRGYLANIDPLAQPVRRQDVARALVGLDPDSLSGPVAAWVRMLQEELAPELEGIAGQGRRSYGFTGAVGGRASTSQRLDPARPVGDEGGWPWWRAGAWVETGPIAVETRLYGDTYFNDDPDGRNPGQPRGGRSDNAYLSVQLPRVALDVGRFQRNWAPLGTSGLAVSGVATPYTSLGMKLDLGRFVLRAFTAELDTALGQKRYLSAHELSYRGGESFFLSLGESVLYASQRGGLSLRYLNPMEFLFFDLENEPADLTANLMLSAQVWARKGPLVVRGELALDDLSLFPPGDTAVAPARYALDLGLVWARPHSPFTLSAGYRQVSSFAYRTSTGVDRYTYLDRGLGDNFADYDRLTLSLEFTPPGGALILAPTLLAQRQGEGGVREPFPAVYDDFLNSPWLFLGVRETTYRAALRGRLQPLRQLWLGWDLGPNWVRNQAHVAGRRATEFQATGEIGFRLQFPH